MVGASNSVSSSFVDGQGIARIVGMTCIVGFVVDMTALVFPLGAGTAWRVGLLLQMGDRSIVLLIGIALLIYSAWESQGLRKLLAYLSLGLGAFFLLMGMLVVRDSFALYSQTIANIGNQVSQLETQVEASRSNPEITANATEDDFTNAVRAIETQAETLRQNAKTSITRSGVASTSNFAVVGISLLSLGRLSAGAKGRGGMRSTKKMRR
ncbi:HpsJ-like protein, cyanoexosortase C-associated [Nodosilinea sp. AN01ver1]|uniref:HpsJ-like protein, cyanoexosortase C-associated n=1 Tax=Nodosilinea sp. AN01ver1 TaxID=3423362 RepID=UPI003D315518